MSSLARLLAVFMVAALGLVAGCAPRTSQTSAQGPEAPASDTSPLLVHGNISFHAAFTRSGRVVAGTESAAQPGHQGLSMLRVCLVRAFGVKDFRFKGMLGDDVVVGCSATDAAGNYGIAVDQTRCPKAGCDGRYYLVTDLCSIAAGHAQTCVALNAKLGPRFRKQPWDKPAQWRKFIWSDTFNLSSVHSSHTVSWNLSCPSESGVGIPLLQCGPRSIEPPGRFYGTNSNFGFNQEAIHAAQAGGLVVRRLGDLRPNSKTTLQPKGYHCGGSKDRLSDKKWFCQDAIRIVISDATRAGNRKERPCRLETRHYFTNPRTVCTVSPDNPSIVIHEIGHILHVRFMNYRGGVNAATTPTKWADGTAQKTQTSEGWANFFAAAVLFDRHAENPDFNGQNIERNDDRRLSGSCTATTMRGEGRTSQFFWDLYDPPSDDEPWDNISVDLRTLLEVWSLFPGKHGKYAKNRTKGECDPHGRNVWDFAHYFSRHPDDLGDLRPIQNNNCVDRQLRSMSCGN